MREQWRFKAGIFAAGCLAFAELYSTQAILPAIAHDLGSSPAQASLTIATTTTAVALGSLVLALRPLRYDKRKSIALSGWALAGAAGLSAAAPTLAALLVARALEGLLIPIVFTSAVALAGERPDEAGSLVGWYMSGVSSGSFLSRFLAGLGTQIFGWRHGLAADGLLAAGLAWLSFVLLPRSAATDERAGGDSHVSLAATPLLKLYAIGWAALFVSVGAFTFLSLRLAGPPFALSPGVIGLVSAVFLASTLAMPAVGWLTDRVGSAMVLRGSQVVGALGVACTLSRSIALNVTGLAAISLGVFAVQTAANARAVAFAGARRRQATGLYLASYYAGGTCAPLALAPLWSASGWPSCAIAILLMQVLIFVIAV
jgi:MFS transporter, YNFM family, putative membrane transport protein